MHKNMMIVIGVVAVVLVAAVGALALLGGGDNKPRTTIDQMGSDTLLDLMTNMAEGFNDAQDSAAVQVTGGGSGVGINALIEGTIDVAQASREMKASEMENAQNRGVEPVEFSVAIDGIAIIVNGNNGVTELTMEQLQGIYNGTYTNWEQVGGADMAITSYGRQSTSGTYEFFKEAVMDGEDFSTGVSQETGNSAIATKVMQTAGGIGYVGIGYATQAQGAKIVPLKADGASEAFLPTDQEAVYSGDYELSRHLYLYTDGTPTGAVLEWLKYVLSEEGQAIVEDTGFYKLDPATLAEMEARLG